MTLSVPIFDNKTNKTNVAKAKIDKLNTSLKLQSKLNDVAQNVETTAEPVKEESKEKPSKSLSTDGGLAVQSSDIAQNVETPAESVKEKPREVSQNKNI